MRILVLAVFALFVTPALAQGWAHYDNVRYGFGIDIPGEFEAQGSQDAAADGQVFASRKNSDTLLVWGGKLQSDFNADVASAMSYASADAWNVAGQTSTPRWAQFSAVKGMRMLYHRMIMLCDNTSYAAFRLEYMSTDATKMEQVINRLDRSLRGAGC